MTFVQTVLGRIDPSEMGITYSHDHLIFRPPSPFKENEPDLRLESYDAALQELGYFKMAGGQAFVEMTTVDTGRSVTELESLARETGVHILTPTGFNKAKFAEEMVAARTEDELYDDMVRELTEGIEGTSIRAGLIKAASSRDRMTDGERKVFHAAARAHKTTGAPISTHTEAGTYALEQIDLLVSAGVDPSHICIGHLDRKLEWDYHEQIGQTGVFMLFDQISKEKYYPDAERIAFIKRHIEAGRGGQILLGSDLARMGAFPSNGFGNGPGLTYILWRFVPWMLQSGVSREDVDRLLIHNPARAFSWREQ